MISEEKLLILVIRAFGYILKYIGYNIQAGQFQPSETGRIETLYTAGCS